MHLKLSSSILLLLASICFGDKEADLKVQKDFQEMDGEDAQIRDDCLQKSSLKIEDLTIPDKLEDLPEGQLCFYKCWYEESGLVVDGDVVLEKLDELIPEVKELSSDDAKQLNECIKNVPKITKCADVLELELCLSFYLPDEE